MRDNTLLIIPFIVLLLGLVAALIIIDPNLSLNNLQGAAGYDDIITDFTPFVSSNNLFYDYDYLVTNISSYNDSTLNLSIRVIPWELNGFFVYKNIYYTYEGDTDWHQVTLNGTSYDDAWIEGSAYADLLLPDAGALVYVLAFVCQEYNIEDLEAINAFYVLSTEEQDSLRVYLENHNYLCGVKFNDGQVVSNAWTLDYFIIDPCVANADCPIYNNSGVCYFNGTCVEGICEYDISYSSEYAVNITETICEYTDSFMCTDQGKIFVTVNDTNKGCAESICDFGGWNNSMCACIDGDTQDCGIDVGACQKGIQTCSQGTWGTCMGAISPTTETLNNLDDDCDGQIDEGLCGNEYIDAGEECDKTNLTTSDCSDLPNMYEGTLTCNNDCTLNKNNCCAVDCSYDGFCNTACEQNAACSDDIDCVPNYTSDKPGVICEFPFYATKVQTDGVNYYWINRTYSSPIKLSLTKTTDCMINWSQEIDYEFSDIDVYGTTLFITGFDDDYVFIKSYDFNGDLLNTKNIYSRANYNYAQTYFLNEHIFYIAKGLGVNEDDINLRKYVDGSKILDVNYDTGTVRANPLDILISDQEIIYVSRLIDILKLNPSGTFVQHKSDSYNIIWSMVLDGNNNLYSLEHVEYTANVFDHYEINKFNNDFSSTTIYTTSDERYKQLLIDNSLILLGVDLTTYDLKLHKFINNQITSTLTYDQKNNIAGFNDANIIPGVSISIASFPSMVIDQNI